MCTCQEQIIICLLKHEIAGVVICHGDCWDMTVNMTTTPSIFHGQQSMLLSFSMALPNNHHTNDHTCNFFHLTIYEITTMFHPHQGYVHSTSYGNHSGFSGLSLWKYNLTKCSCTASLVRVYYSCDQFYSVLIWMF